MKRIRWGSVNHFVGTIPCVWNNDDDNSIYDQTPNPIEKPASYLGNLYMIDRVINVTFLLYVGSRRK